jgi:hypothetical protein
MTKPKRYAILLYPDDDLDIELREWIESLPVRRRQHLIKEALRRGMRQPEDSPSSKEDSDSETFTL